MQKAAEAGQAGAAEGETKKEGGEDEPKVHEAEEVKEDKAEDGK